MSGELHEPGGVSPSTTARVMQVRVLLFAVLRERAGTGQLLLALDHGARVADALRAAREIAPLGELMGAMPVHVALNRDYADPEAPLAEGDEIALIPPLSGGARAASLPDGD